MRLIKWLLILFLLAILAWLVYAFFNYRERLKTDEGATYLKPRLKASSIKVKSYSSESTVLDLGLVIDNPTPLGFSLDSARYVIFIDGLEVTRDGKAELLQLKGGDSSLLHFPMTINNRRLTHILEKLKLEKSDTVEYRIHFNFYTRLPFMKGKPLTYVFSEYAPLYIVPEMKVQRISILKAGLKNASLNLRVKVINPSAFPFSFRDSRYKLRLGGEEVATGTFTENIILPAEGEKTFDIPVSLKTTMAVKKAAAALLKPKKTSYYFYYSCEVLGASETNDSRFEYEMQDDAIPVDAF